MAHKIHKAQEIRRVWAPEDFARALLNSRATIVIDNNLMRKLGYEDTRKFFEELGNWGYNSDFGKYPPKADVDVQTYLKLFIKENFAD